jgi:hypothetical protein
MHPAAAGPAGTIWVAAEIESSDRGSLQGIAVLDDRNRCIVPDLRRDDLAAARLALRQRGCRAGRITRSNPHHLGRALLSVTRQKPRAGAVRKGGAKVAFKLAG